MAGVVVVDEAYMDFSGLPSACGLIEKYPNIIVLQTLSKAFGLAGSFPYHHQHPQENPALKGMLLIHFYRHSAWNGNGERGHHSADEQCEGSLQCEQVDR